MNGSYTTDQNDSPLTVIRSNKTSACDVGRTLRRCGGGLYFASS